MSGNEEMSRVPGTTAGKKVACDDSSDDEDGVCSYKPTNKYVYPGKSKRCYQCGECGKRYVTNQGLKRHLMEHTGDYPFKCEQCPKVFAGISEFKKHLRSHTGERPFKCEICQKDFVYAESLESHASVHSDERPFQCSTPGCPAKYKNKSSLDIHKRSCLTGNFKSGIRALVPEEVGGLTYYRPPQLVEKIAKRRKNYGNEIEECPVCQTRIKKKSIRFHIQSHTNHPRPIKTFTCAECERVFKSKEHLTRHLAIHDDNRPVHKCNLCDKTYMSKEAFRRHSKTHAEGGGRTRCLTCGVMCTNLPRHLKYHTLPYVCQYCLKRFARSDTLQRHQRSGKKEEVIFECQMCNKSFESRKCLDYHETTHDDEDESYTREPVDSVSDSDEQSFSTDSSCSSSSNNEEWQELNTGREIDFKECCVIIKRADFIESTVAEEFGSVRITRLGRKSNEILYTPIP